MAIEFLRMKVRRKAAATLLLSGGATLHPDGTLDLFGDAVAHADLITDAIESVEAGKAADTLPHARVLADDCGGCPLAARVGRACSCLQIDRFRIGTAESLLPIALRPGLPPAELADGSPLSDAGRAASPWRDFAKFRMARSRGAAQALVSAAARAA